jgi:hypothetical protein
MLVVGGYAIGKFSVMQSSQNVVSATFLYQNDPYSVDLNNWNL